MPRSRTSSASELLVELHRDDPTPLHRQLEHELREPSGAVASAPMPSSRRRAPRRPARPVPRRRRRGLRAARRRGLPRQPARAGRRSSRPRRPAAQPTAGRRRPPRASTSRTAGPTSRRSRERPGCVDQAGLHRDAERPPRVPRRRGAHELRVALATYLDRVRGTCADPDDIVICDGFAQACALLARCSAGAAAGGSPSRILGLPGPPAGAGPRPRGRPVPVDESGWTSRPSRARASMPSWSHPPTSSRPAASSRPSAAPRSSPGRSEGDRCPRGRLRRRVPLRPRAHRRHPGPRARPGRLRRVGEQDAGAGSATGLAARPRGSSSRSP